MVSQSNLPPHYETDVVAQWAEPFSRLLLASVPIKNPAATVLDVMCGTGSVALPLVDRLESRGRVVALDQSNAMLDVARRKAGSLLGKRLFFRHERVERLTFADEVFDLVVSNAGVLELTSPDKALAECVRVTKPGGGLAMTLTLRGSLQELHDLFREVLERHDRTETIEHLDQHIRSYPSDNEAIARFEGLGLTNVSLTRSTFRVSYNSGKEFIESALVAHRFLSRWSEVVGSDDAQMVFAELVTTIDTYYGSDPFEVTIQAACVVGDKEDYEVLDDSDQVVSVESIPRNTPRDPQRQAREDSSDRETPVREIPIPPEASRVGQAPGDTKKK